MYVCREEEEFKRKGALVGWLAFSQGGQDIRSEKRGRKVNQQERFYRRKQTCHRRRVFFSGDAHRNFAGFSFDHLLVSLWLCLWFHVVLNFIISPCNICLLTLPEQRTFALQICNLWIDVMEKVAREDFLKGTMYNRFPAPEIKKRPAFECAGRWGMRENAAYECLLCRL